MNNNKVLISITILVIIAIGATFAWWAWSTTDDQKTNVSLTIDGMTINYEDGEDIVGAGLIPVSDVKAMATSDNIDENNTVIYKTIAVSAPMATYLNLYMTLEEFPDELADKTFLYSIENDSEVITSGNFEGKQQGNRIQLLNREEVGTEVITYHLYIWIDGNQDNPTSMMNQNFKFVLSADGTTEPINRPEPETLDESGANVPNLLDEMIPIVYDETKSSWVVANITDANSEYKWYDYNEKKWANAVLVTSDNRLYYQNAEVGTVVLETDVLAYYVWIPRYKYKVFNINKTMEIDSYNAETTGIDIVFESGISSTGTITCEYDFTDANGDGIPEDCKGTNGEYYTHPAFKFGDTDLEGIWASKFEISTIETSKCYTSADNDDCISTSLPIRVKPNATPWMYNYLDNFTVAIQKMNDNGNEYGLTTNSDPHMIKNMEWGAIAYLTNSNYGRCSEGTCTNMAKNTYYDSDSKIYYKTGCGPQSKENSNTGTICNDYTTELGQSASTTGNIYGIYDMNAGGYEFVMGNVSNSSGSYEYNSTHVSTSYTYTLETAKYIDTYYGGASKNDQEAYNRARLGDATGEIAIYVGINVNSGWYGSYAYFPTYSDPWFERDCFAGMGASSGIFSFCYYDGSNSNATRSIIAIVK